MYLNETYRKAVILVPANMGAFAPECAGAINRICLPVFIKDGLLSYESVLRGHSSLQALRSIKQVLENRACIYRHNSKAFRAKYLSFGICISKFRVFNFILFTRSS